MDPRDPAAADLPRQLERHLRATRVIRPGSAVLVALSGGLDSTALAHLLRFPLGHWKLRLMAAHLDHAMRPDSARDAAWVRGLCRAWDLPHAIERLPHPPRSEAEARRERYAFLSRVAEPGAVIATAHHRDDQAETVLFNAVRGTGLRGLRGIAPRRGPVVRPLLPFGRPALRDYAARSGLAFREDPTNLDLSFARNRIRHVVLPALERVHPGTARNLARLADAARRVEPRAREAARRLAADAILEADAASATLARDVLRSYHPEVRARVLRHVLRRYGSMPGRAGTQAALEFINSGRSGGELHLAGGVRIELDFGRARIARTAVEPLEDTLLEIREPSAGAGMVRIGGRRLHVWWGPAPAAAESVALPPEVALPLQLRGWQPGDRIRLSGGTRKLKKLFAERRMDRRARRQAAVLVDAAGRVLWVPGVARAEGLGETGGFHIAVADVEQR